MLVEALLHLVVCSGSLAQRLPTRDAFAPPGLLCMVLEAFPNFPFRSCADVGLHWSVAASSGSKCSVSGTVCLCWPFLFRYVSSLYPRSRHQHGKLCRLNRVLCLLGSVIERSCGIVVVSKIRTVFLPSDVFNRAP